MNWRSMNWLGSMRVYVESVLVVSVGMVVGMVVGGKCC